MKTRTVVTRLAIDWSRPSINRRCSFFYDTEDDCYVERVNWLWISYRCRIQAVLEREKDARFGKVRLGSENIRMPGRILGNAAGREFCFPASGLECPRTCSRSHLWKTVFPVSPPPAQVRRMRLELAQRCTSRLCWAARSPPPWGLASTLIHFQLFSIDQLVSIVKVICLTYDWIWGLDRFSYGYVWLADDRGVSSFSANRTFRSVYGPLGYKYRVTPLEWKCPKEIFSEGNKENDGMSNARLFEKSNSR